MTQRPESIEKRRQRQENGTDAANFARECGAEFHHVVFQNMDICNGPCRIIAWHLPKAAQPKPAKYDSMLITVEYEDGSFSSYVHVQGKSWQDQINAAKRGAAASQLFSDA